MRPLKPAVFTLVTVVLAVACVEIGLRAIVAVRLGSRALTYGLRPDRDVRTSADRHDDARAGYTKYFPHQPLTDRDPVTGERFAIHVNAQGFRGDDFGPKPPGTRRVVTLGASSTFGYDARDDATYPARLQVALRQYCPIVAWDVLNLGIPHLMSDEILQLFREEALVLDPDVVTFYEGINDASARRERQRLRRRLHRMDLPRTIYRAVCERLLLLRFLDEVARPRLASFDSAAVAAHLEERGASLFRSLDTIREECEERGILFVVVSQQAKSYLVPANEIRGVSYADEEALVRARLEREGSLRPTELWFHAHAQLMADLRDWVRTHHVVFVDGIAALDAHRDWLVSWVHLSPAANDRLAQAIAGPILERLCPDGAARPEAQP